MNAKIYGLYCVCSRCPEEQTRYVGQALDMDRRFKRHLRDSHEGPLPSSRWIAKHGVDNIRHRILEEVVDISKLNEREIHWIAALGTYSGAGGNGLNLTVGGLHGITGLIRPESVRTKISDSLRGHPVSADTVAKIKKTRHDREHGGGPPSRTTCIYCYPNGRPPAKSSAHSRFHFPGGYWKEGCLQCAPAEYRSGKMSRPEYVAAGLPSKTDMKVSGARSAHIRWHTNKGVSSPDCLYCGV